MRRTVEKVPKVIGYPLPIYWTYLSLDLCGTAVEHTSTDIIIGLHTEAKSINNSQDYS